MDCLNMSYKNKIIILLFFIILSVSSFGQRTAYYKDPEAAFRSGFDLLEKEKYGAAQKAFETVIEAEANPLSQLRISAEYYDALCALELYNGDAEYKFTEFLRNHPSSSRVNLIYFQLGRLAYINKKFNSAQDYFDKVDASELNAAQLDEFYFKKGYCCFKTEDLDKAKENFQKITKPGSKYISPANYYLSHIAYTKGDYETALKGFNDLMNDDNFKVVAPYYIIQILFVQEKYDEVLAMAPGMLETATEKRAPEINRVIGESYYRTGKFEEALKYLENYHQTKGLAVEREDNYSYAFCLYKAGQYEKAADYFQKVTGTQDEMAQYAYYYLADCYLKMDKKQFAANAFNSAYKLTFDTDIREDALFNQAQLAFDLSYDPYNEAIKALKDYLRNYPNSSRNDEAYHFLYRISLATGNYMDAQDALDNIKLKGSDYNTNYQKIALYRGIEYYNQFNDEEAIKMFKKAASIDADKAIAAESMFWTGESFYRSDNLWGADKYYADFLALTEGKKLPFYNLANYNLGYINFKKEEYADARLYFQKFISNVKNEDPAITTDAYLRLGDSWFVSKNYDEAISNYDKAIKLGNLDVDYAMFQKAKALGVLSRYDEEIQTLNKVLKQYPNSSLVSEAQFELGNTYLLLKDNENALINFKKVVSDYPNSSFALKARLKSGLIYYNSEQYDLALSTFKKVVEDFPNTPESREALVSIKNIYVEMNKVEDYLAYANSLPNAVVRISEQDSLLYISAEKLYLNSDYAGALPSLEKYVEKFPQGAFVTGASFYLADCQLKEGRKEDALKNYEVVLTNPRSEFTETALLKAAMLSYGLGKYDTSLAYFTSLETIAEDKANVTEAWYGKMRSNYMLKNYEGTLVDAAKLLSVEKLSDPMKLEAMTMRANAYYFSDELMLAKSEYRKITEISQGDAGAEAMFNIAEIEFKLADNTAAEKNCFELINRYTAYDYWVAKGFILLSDVYMKNGNNFQAKQTLQSIIDNYDGDDLRKIAGEKLTIIIQNENLKVEESKQADTLNGGETIKLEEEPVEVELQKL
jgi:TolA-binding protein